ncbi:hypothetical protein KKA03_01420 [archaeon]|nr:hypothetical protein [archaeon]
MEAILVIGMAVIVLTSFFNINMARYSTAKDIGEAGEARIAGEVLATGINTGYSNGEGFSIHVGESKLNFTKLGSAGVSLPIVIDSSAKTITISKNTTSGGGGVWNISVPVIPSDLLRVDSTASYPEVTILNNGSYLIIYATSSNIVVN